MSSPVFLLDESISSILPILSGLVQCSSFKIQLHTSQTWPLLYQYRYGTLSPSSISAHSLFNCTLGLTLAILTPLWKQPHNERFDWSTTGLYLRTSPVCMDILATPASQVASWLACWEWEREREEGREGREGWMENNKFGVFWMLYSLQVKLWLPCCSG